MDRRFVVFVQWDAEASVWVATSDDIPGLVTESASLDTLVDRVIAVAPELLEDNVSGDDDDLRRLLDLCVRAEIDGSRHAAH